MLRKETVSSKLLEYLKRLMALPLLNNHRLVGGTGLALQIGHRISVDIDLFSDSKNDYIEIEKIVCAEFVNEIKIGHYINSPFGKGISFFLDGIKTDIIDWETPFNHIPLVIDTIRIASKEEIARMKLDIITSPSEFARYDKKDYFDLACILDDFTILQMIEMYKKSHPLIKFPERIVLEAFQYAELADKKPNPNMLIDMSWNGAKKKIQFAIEQYLSSNF